MTGRTQAIVSFVVLSGMSLRKNASAFGVASRRKLQLRNNPQGRPIAAYLAGRCLMSWYLMGSLARSLFRS